MSRESPIYNVIILYSYILTFLPPEEGVDFWAKPPRGATWRFPRFLLREFQGTEKLKFLKFDYSRIHKSHQMSIVASSNNLPMKRLAVAAKHAPRKRRRKGIRDKKVYLNCDLIDMLLPFIEIASVRHILLLSMTNTGLRDQIQNNHEMWRRMYLRLHIFCCIFFVFTHENRKSTNFLRIA